MGTIKTSSMGSNDQQGASESLEVCFGRPAGQTTAVEYDWFDKRNDPRRRGPAGTKVHLNMGRLGTVPEMHVHVSGAVGG